jgi:hypothetical protein
MSITRRAVIREGTQTRVTREIRRLEHDVAPTGVAYQVVTTSFVRSENDRA